MLCLNKRHRDWGTIECQERGLGGDCANDTITKGSNTIGNSPLCLWPNLGQHLPVVDAHLCHNRNAQGHTPMPQPPALGHLPQGMAQG